MPQFFAKSISQIFSPIIVWPIFLFILLPAQPTAVWWAILLLEFVVPAVLIAVFMKLRLISDLDITQVKERRLFFFIVIVAHACATWLIWDPLRLLGLMVELIGTVITFRWKISVHLAVNSFVISVILIRFGWQWWPLLLILLVVAWSRIVLHKHTLLQTIAGAALPLVIIFGYQVLL